MQEKLEPAGPEAAEAAAMMAAVLVLFDLVVAALEVLVQPHLSALIAQLQELLHPIMESMVQMAMQV